MFIAFLRVLVENWTSLCDWSSNSLATMSQSSTLATKPRTPLLPFSYSLCLFITIGVKYVCPYEHKMWLWGESVHATNSQKNYSYVENQYSFGAIKTVIKTVFIAPKEYYLYSPKRIRELVQSDYYISKNRNMNFVLIYGSASNPKEVEIIL